MVVCRPRSLKNGVPQSSTLSPLLFNIYISDLPHTQSQQYGYADDLALLYVDKNWNKIEKKLKSDMMINEHLCLIGSMETETQYGNDRNDRFPSHHQGS